MPFTLPNDTAAGVNPATYEDQARPDKVDVDILVQALSGVGVTSGCAVTAHGAGSMAVDVAAGAIVPTAGGAAVTVAAQANVSVTAADGTNPRIDLVTVNSAGTVSMVNGTAAAVPCMPNTSNVVVAAVYLPASQASVVAGMLTDKRAVVPAPSGSYARRTWARIEFR